MLPLAVALLLAGPPAGEAERLATRALQAAAPPAESLADARRALSLTAEFDASPERRAQPTPARVSPAFTCALAVT